MQIELDDELGSLLDSLNALAGESSRGELPGFHGLSRPIELKLLDLLTSQLDRELISYNMVMASLEKRVDGVFQKGYELLVMSDSLREREGRA